MRTITIGAVFAFAVLLHSDSAFAEGFAFEMENPRVRITIPGLPAIKMKPHSMRKFKPHLRFEGSSTQYNISIMTPTADAGMTPMECASSRASSYASIHGLSESQFKVFKLNDNTFLMMCRSDFKVMKQINAYLFSACGGTHCIDVHISMMTNLDSDMDKLFSSFKGANIHCY